MPNSRPVVCPATLKHSACSWRGKDITNFVVLSNQPIFPELTPGQAGSSGDCWCEVILQAGRSFLSPNQQCRSTEAEKDSTSKQWQLFFRAASFAVNMWWFEVEVLPRRQLDGAVWRLSVMASGLLVTSVIFMTRRPGYKYSMLGTPHPRLR